MDTSINIKKDHKPKDPKRMRIKKKVGEKKNKCECKKWIKAKRRKRQKMNCVSVSDTNCKLYYYYYCCCCYLCEL